LVAITFKSAVDDPGRFTRSRVLGAHQDPAELLPPVYGWFTEGFDARTSRRQRHCWRS
jgi:hypothetical protein